jgi:hypothetical protein
MRFPDFEILMEFVGRSVHRNVVDEARRAGWLGATARIFFTRQQ